MRKKREIFVLGEYYHVFSRTILNIPEFKDAKNANRLKLIFLIANSTDSSKVFHYIRNNKNPVLDHIIEILNKNNKLVDVISYTIMFEHYHLLLREKREGGIHDFIHKTNTSIAKYINTKNERKGPLFERRYNVKHIDSNEYLLHLWRYIHLNPLDILLGKGWRSGKIKNWELAMTKLSKYPWSSLNFFTKGTEDPILSGTDIIRDQFKGKKLYDKFLRSWAEDDFNMWDESTK